MIRPLLVLLAAALLAPAAAGAREPLPVLSLTTSGPVRDEPKVAGRLVVPGSYRGRVGVELRGQSSLRFPKQNLAVELRDARGEDRRAGLLGLPADGDWVLHASYLDKTFLRNLLAFDVARRMGRWAPRTRLVELRRNGGYAGVHTLMERPELSRNRVDVDGDGVTGKYLVEWTYPYQARRKGGSFRLPRTGYAALVEEPSAEDLGPAEGRYVRGLVRRTERAVYGSGPAWRTLLDEGSAIDYTLVQELFRNVDAFKASTYLHKGAGEKLAFGPVWDFDLSSGTARQNGAARTTGWWTTGRPWASQLWRDCAFRARLGRRWQALVAGGLPQALLATLDRERARLTAGPAGRNFRRWPTLDVRLWQAPEARGSFTAEARYLRGWLDRRMAWMASATRSTPRC